MDGIWVLYLFLAAIPALIVVAAVYKYLEVMQASRWPSTPGRIVTSRTETRDVESGGPDDDDTEARTFAKIEYDYKVADRTYRGNRVSIGEDMGNFEIAQTLAKYPVGKPVTVYYNPNKREQSVLERDVPPGLWKGVAIIVLVLIALIVGGIVGFKQLGAFVASTIPNAADAPFVTACIGFALLCALVIYAIQRNAARARSWPTVFGRIEKSGVHEFQSLDRDHGHARWRTQYRPDILYSYEVAGVRYTGDKSASSGRISSNLDAFAKKAAAANPIGKVVQVHYNPDNPAESVIDPRSGFLWLLWIVPVAMLALAYFVGR